MNQVPADMFAEYEVENSFLQNAVQSLLLSLRESTLPESDALWKKANQLKATVEQRFGWTLSLNIDLEEGDDAPTIVEM